MAELCYRCNSTLLTGICPVCSDKNALRRMRQEAVKKAKVKAMASRKHSDEQVIELVAQAYQRGYRDGYEMGKRDCGPLGGG